MKIWHNHIKMWNIAIRVTQNSTSGNYLALNPEWPYDRLFYILIIPLGFPIDYHTGLSQCACRPVISL